jgi:nickel-dependent lactate racemase
LSPTISDGAPERVVSPTEMRSHLQSFLENLGYTPRRVLLVPPDITRFYSEAGPITQYLYNTCSETAEIVHILPALGTHTPMTKEQIQAMFGQDIPMEKFLVHDWRDGVKKIGTVPAEYVRELSDGNLDFDIDVEIDTAITDGNYDLILSIGQIVPHEVVGMANYTKNIVIGAGGADMINRSHFLGAVADMETLMGRTDSPVRSLLNHAFDTFLGHLPIHFIMTVIGSSNGELVMRGLFAGKDKAYEDACRLSRMVNLDLLEAPLKKVVVYLEPSEFKSTWLGNKAVYRTRMAIADEGELIILAPAVREFGEDPEIDQLIRKYGYVGTPQTLRSVDECDDLAGNLSAAAHLIHGASEGRFQITYCTRPQNLSKEEVESVGFNWADYDRTVEKFNPDSLQDGINEIDGEQIFFIGNPALGLWALRESFED